MARRRQEIEAFVRDLVVEVEAAEAAGMTEQQSGCLGHEIQTHPQPTESYEIQWYLCLRKPQPWNGMFVANPPRRACGHDRRSLGPS
jgi:hypothetical protein